MPLEIERPQPGRVISYLEMCLLEGASLQRGMNFGTNGRASVILMSQRTGAPYADRVEDDGAILIYEGHDALRSEGLPDPKTVDQPSSTPSGALTQNGLFLDAAMKTKEGLRQPEKVRVYEKIRTGTWVYNGQFDLLDAWREQSGQRKVFKFRLAVASEGDVKSWPASELEHNRLIPSEVKRLVWARDKGRCVLCGTTDNLHFDHVIPFAKGGSSLVVENIQLLCARHNLAKRDRIE